MQAKKGDRIVVKSHKVGHPAREGRILEVRGEKGGPPYLVRWSDDGHEGLLFPGPDAMIETPKKRSD